MLTGVRSASLCNSACVSRQQSVGDIYPTV